MSAPNPERRFIRRHAIPLIVAGGIFVAALGTGAGAGTALILEGKRTGGITYTNPVVTDPRVESILKTPVVIDLAGVNIREYPAFPIKDPRRDLSYRLSERLSLHSDRLTPREIVAINGTPLDGARRIVVQNASIVRGAPTGMFEQSTGRWLRLEDIKLRDNSVTTRYIALSDATRSGVMDLGGDRAFESSSNSENRGKVTAYPGLDYSEIWVRVMGDKIKGGFPIYDRPGANPYLYEHLYPEVFVVSAGKDWVEKMEMETQNKRVTVRAYPAEKFPDGRNTLLGTVALGTSIKRVVMTESWQWGAAVRGNVEGEILDESGKVVTVDQNRVVVIGSEYLQASLDSQIFESGDGKGKGKGK